MTYRSSDPLNQIERTQLGRMVEDLIDRARLHRSCLTCGHFDEASEFCSIANQRPPARIIALGCPSYLEIPPF